MGRNLRVYHNLPHCGPATPYSLVLEQRGVSEILLVENYAIVPLGEYEEAHFSLVASHETARPYLSQLIREAQGERPCDAKGFMV